ncbi:MAG: NTP transferase domain-containing protein [Methanoregula sp.]|jgi:NDP-sugar pyrophosphorylase family protein|nr:NTP transferase domain-containing protein [Methanoregula sp.]
MQAIILAGGKGRRLMPYTTVLPKPLMPIGDYSILEVILRQLKHYGFGRVTISTGYLHELIHAYLNSNKSLGLELSYSHEDSPLGTIGPLRLLEKLDDTFLVMNGDILTDINYRELIESHKKKKAVATVATYQRDVNIDFGVLEKGADQKIVAFKEKPTFHFDVSMGVYVFSKKILDYVPDGEPFGFDQLMYTLTGEKAAVYSYPHTGYWLDIGRPDDYARSIEEFERYKDRFLP